jgi:type-F conjugative transfer system pilin assembly thiol-disulfide isomerase TrbB
MKPNRMIKLAYVLIMGLGTAHASVRDEVAALYNPQGIAALAAPGPVLTTPPKTAPAARWYTLSTGKRVDLSQWKVVLFMQGHCPYCHQFDPLLKQVGANIGLSVFPYTIDGQGDQAYPDALPAPAEVMQTFFPAPMPIATPTTFLVNVNTLDAWPIMQGASDERGFLNRLDTVLQDASTKVGNVIQEAK